MAANAMLMNGIKFRQQQFALQQRAKGIQAQKQQAQAMQGMKVEMQQMREENQKMQQTLNQPRFDMFGFEHGRRYERVELEETLVRVGPFRFVGAWIGGVGPQGTCQVAFKYKPHPSWPVGKVEFDKGAVVRPMPVPAVSPAADEWAAAPPANRPMLLARMEFLKGYQITSVTWPNGEIHTGDFEPNGLLRSGQINYSRTHKARMHFADYKIRSRETAPNRTFQWSTNAAGHYYISSFEGSEVGIDGAVARGFGLWDLSARASRPPCIYCHPSGRSLTYIEVLQMHQKPAHLEWRLQCKPSDGSDAALSPAAKSAVSSARSDVASAGKDCESFAIYCFAIFGPCCLCVSQCLKASEVKKHNAQLMDAKLPVRIERRAGCASEGKDSDHAQEKARAGKASCCGSCFGMCYYDVLMLDPVLAPPGPLLASPADLMVTSHLSGGRATLASANAAAPAGPPQHNMDANRTNHGQQPQWNTPQQPQWNTPQQPQWISPQQQQQHQQTQRTPMGQATSQPLRGGPIVVGAPRSAAGGPGVAPVAWAGIAPTAGPPAGVGQQPHPAALSFAASPQAQQGIYAGPHPARMMSPAGAPSGAQMHTYPAHPYSAYAHPLMAHFAAHGGPTAHAHHGASPVMFHMQPHASSGPGVVPPMMMHMQQVHPAPSPVSQHPAPVGPFSHSPMDGQWQVCLADPSSSSAHSAPVSPSLHHPLAGSPDGGFAISSPAHHDAAPLHAPHADDSSVTIQQPAQQDLQNDPAGSDADSHPLKQQAESVPESVGLYHSSAHPTHAHADGSVAVADASGGAAGHPATDASAAGVATAAWLQHQMPPQAQHEPPQPADSSLWHGESAGAAHDSGSVDSVQTVEPNHNHAGFNGYAYGGEDAPANAMDGALAYSSGEGDSAATWQSHDAAHATVDAHASSQYDVDDARGINDDQYNSHHAAPDQFDGGGDHVGGGGEWE